MNARFICPGCGQEAEYLWAGLILSIKRLDLPYFLCFTCATISYDKQVVRMLVTSLRKDDRFAREIPFASICQAAKTHLEAIMKNWVERGYRRVRFRKEGR